MNSLNSNEREFQIQLINWLNELNKNANIFDTITGETTLKHSSGTSRFPDVVFWNNRNAKDAFIFLELKQPSESTTKKEFFDNAREKIDVLRTNYFASFNLRQLSIYQFQKGEFSLIPTFYPTLAINQIDDWLTETNKIAIKNLLFQFFYDVVKLKYEGHLYYEEIDYYFIRKLLEITNALKEYYKTHLIELFLSNHRLRNEVFAWITKQGILIKDADKKERDKFYEMLASQIIYQFIGRLLFYETLRTRIPNKLPPINTKVSNVKELEDEIKEKFERIKSIDYNAVFDIDIPDKIPIPEKSFDVLISFISELKKLNFSNLKQEVLGNIFQSLIPPTERHRLGQYFTPEDVVDFINSFCIRTQNDKVLDPTCGTGTFLVRAYDKFNFHFGKHNHNDLLEQLWGCEFAPFPAELATINLYRQNIQEYINFPRIIKEDFFKLSLNQKVEFPPNKKLPDYQNIKIEIPIPEFDVIVGNFPYIRQEDIEKVDKGYRKKVILPSLHKDWLKIKEDRELFDKTGDIKLSQKSDIYAFMFIHSGAFLKEKGRMGFVTSSAYLDTDFGIELQKFFLRNFKIITIVESRCEPWFTDVSVNTIFTVLEKCSNPKERNSHTVKFVKVKRKLKELIPQDKRFEAIDRHHNLDFLVNKVENCIMEPQEKDILQYEDENFRIRGIAQKNLSDSNFNWGAYLRNPDLFFELYYNKNMTFINDNIIDFKRGKTSGITKFFTYSKNKDLFKSLKVESKYLIPFVNSFRDFNKLILIKEDVDDFVLLVSKEKRHLQGEKVLKYIEWGEKQRSKEGALYPDVPSVKGNKPWYNLGNLISGDIILPRFWRNKFYYPVNKDKAPVSDTVFVGVIDKHKDLICALMNSTLIYFITECNGRQMGDGFLTTYGPDMDRYIIPNPEIFTKKQEQEIIKAFDKLCEREISSIFEEVKMKDRQKLDSLVLSAIGLAPDVHLKKLYEGITGLVRERKLIAEMRKTIKRDKATIDLQKIKERAVEEIIQPNYKKFPDSFIFAFGKLEFKEIQTTGEPLRMGEEFFGTCKIFAGNTQVCEVSIEEAKYLIYSFKPNEYIIKLPVRKDVVMKAVNDYGKYLKEIRQSLFEYLIGRTRDTSATNKIIAEIIREVFNIR